MFETKWLGLMTVCVALLLALPAAAEADFYEAPMLTEMVDAGEIPPVEERLPDNPLVIEPWHEIGEYGGTWNKVSTSEDWAFMRMSMYAYSLVRWDDDGLDIVPNLVEEWEANEDKTVWTLYFREGIRWSDGEPFDVDDFLFWWEEMVLHDEHPEPVPVWAQTVDKVMEVERVDDYTLQFIYDEPQPLVPEFLAMWPDGGLVENRPVPRHYLKQFHPDYSDEYDDFEEFEEQQEWWMHTDSPVLGPWVPVRHDLGERIVWERNPYYWAVDTEGNQLPYIDRVDIDYAEDLEVLKLRVMRGESDMQIRPYFGMGDISLLRQQAAEHGYDLFFWDSGSGSGSVYIPNQTHPDEAKRELYQTPEFLRALSHAINRDRIQRMVYYDQGEQTTATLSPKAVEYHTPEGEKVYEAWRDLAVEYDPEKAEALLDEIGVVDQTGDGWRNLPDGGDLRLRIDMNAEAEDEYFDSSEMVMEFWNDIGLRTSVNPVDGSELEIMSINGEFDIKNSWEIGDGPNHLVFPHWLVPLCHDRWAPLYGVWNSLRGTDTIREELDLDPRDRTPPREKPPEGSPYDELYLLYRQAVTEPDEQVRNQLVYDMIDIHLEHGPFVIGTVADYPRIGVVQDHFKNVPDGDELALGGFVNPWIMVYPAIVSPEQFFIDPAAQ